MKHHGLKCALLTLLMALLVASLGAAADPEQQNDLKTRVMQLEIQQQKLVGDIRGLVDEIRKDRDERRAAITDLTDRVRYLESRLTQPSTEKTDVTPPRRFNVAPATIRVVNNLPVQATVYIDCTPYRVAAGQQLSLPNQDERTITYSYTAEGYGWSASKQKFIRSGTTWELTFCP